MHKSSKIESTSKTLDFFLKTYIQMLYNRSLKCAEWVVKELNIIIVIMTLTREKQYHKSISK